MDIETKFNDLGVDAITGVRLMRLLGIGPGEFYDEGRFGQFHDIISFFKDKPDLEFLVNKITAGKTVDRMTHVWGYVELAKQKIAKDKQLTDLSERKKGLELIPMEKDEMLLSELESSIETTTKELGQLTDQMWQYEK